MVTMDYKWILFCPQLPSIPSSPRVMVWRRMHSAGAVGLDNGLWILPDSKTSEKAIQEIKTYVENQGGTSKTFRAFAFDEVTEGEILDRFQQDRTEEYKELQEQCVDFLAEIDKEIGRKNFSFAEYEENEQDLVKLEAWFEKIKQRDFLGGQLAEEAAQWLEKCRYSLHQFATEVFTNSMGKSGLELRPDEDVAK